MNAPYYVYFFTKCLHKNGQRDWEIVAFASVMHFPFLNATSRWFCLHQSCFRRDRVYEDVVLFTWKTIIIGHTHMMRIFWWRFDRIDFQRRWWCRWVGKQHAWGQKCGWCLHHMHGAETSSGRLAGCMWDGTLAIRRFETCEWNRVILDGRIFWNSNWFSIIELNLKKFIVIL